MPRKKKVLDSVEASIPTKEKWECTRCEHSYETPTGHFYKNSFSQLFKNRGGFSTLCKECVNELFDEYTKRYESERTACMILCHMLDFPFYNSLYDSIVQNSGSCKPGMYARALSCRQYQFQTFATVLTNGELNKNALDVRDEKEQKWSKAEIQARDDVVSVVGYDPFEGHSENDRRYLFSDLIKYFEDGIEDDPYKLSQIIQVVINNGQIRKIDFRLAQLDPMNSADTIKSLNDIKVKLVSNNDKIAKENEISVKNRSNKDAGRNTLTFLMKDMREKDVADGVERIVRDDVAPQLEARLLESAKQNIHPKYGISGITDAKNIVSNVSRNGNVISLIVKDIAKPELSVFLNHSTDRSEVQYGIDKRNGLNDDPRAVNIGFNDEEDEAVGGTMFANWIEHGLWMDLEWYFRSEGAKMKRPKREFIKPVQLEAAMIVKTALHGL